MCVHCTVDGGRFAALIAHGYVYAEILGRHSGVANTNERHAMAYDELALRLAAGIGVSVANTHQTAVDREAETLWKAHLVGHACDANGGKDKD